MIPMAAPRVRSRAAYVRSIASAAAAVVCAACGGGSSSPTSPSPSPPPSVPVSNSCSAIGIAIVNVLNRSTAASPVVLVNMRGADGVPTGSRSEPVIASRAVLTAAHCLAGSVGSVRIFLGTGNWTRRAIVLAYPGYQKRSGRRLDVGGRRMSDELLGLSAGSGALQPRCTRRRDGDYRGLGQRSEPGGVHAPRRIDNDHRGGKTQLETQYSATASSVCSGDLGGPLLLQEDGVWAVAGITSAVTTTACSFGTNYFANVRNANITSFILDQVPDAARREHERRIRNPVRGMPIGTRTPDLTSLSFDTLRSRLK